MSGAILAAEEVRFINVVALRRLLHDRQTPPAPALELDRIKATTPSRRAAEVAAAVLRPGALAGAALPTALLAVVCQLARDGYRLVAPQGAAAGMVRGLATGNVSVTAFAAWVEDRAVAE